MTSPRRSPLLVTSTQPLVHCPTCASPARRMPRRDGRTVSDLPWGPRRVVLHLRVRQFFCANGRLHTPDFYRAAITTRRSLGAAAHALAGAHRDGAGGRAGGQLSHALGLAVSRHTRLRLLRRLPLPGVAPPHVLGVDDWAYRKRQT
jgi:transposase